jgi:hypothetical protein
LQDHNNTLSRPPVSLKSPKTKEIGISEPSMQNDSMDHFYDSRQDRSRPKAKNMLEEEEDKDSFGLGREMDELQEECIKMNNFNGFSGFKNFNAPPRSDKIKESLFRVPRNTTIYTDTHSQRLDEEKASVSNKIFTIFFVNVS